jgi:hypothetical protein
VQSPVVGSVGRRSSAFAFGVLPYDARTDMRPSTDENARRRQEWLFARSDFL